MLEIPWAAGVCKYVQFLLHDYNDVKIWKVEEAVLMAGSNKKLILVLNKIGELYDCVCLVIHVSNNERLSAKGSSGKMDEVSEE